MTNTADAADRAARRERIQADAAALGLTPEQYAGVLVDGLCDAILAKRAGGRAVLDATETEPEAA